MRQEIVECLDFGTGLPVNVLDEKLIEYLKSKDEWGENEEETNRSISAKKEIADFPVQDTFWSMTEVTLEHKDLSHIRMLILSDTGTSKTSTVQFSLDQAAHVSLEDQAIQLLYQGCCQPLDGRKARKPRFLCQNIPTDVSDAIQSETDKLGIHYCGNVSSKEEVDTLRKSFRSKTYFRQCSACGVSGTPSFFDNCDKCSAVLYCCEKCKREGWQESHQDWCVLFKKFMDVEADLAYLPFDFSSETTTMDFHDEKKREFFNKHKINGQGLWRLEYQPSQEDIFDNYNLQQQNEEFASHSVFGVEEDNCILEIRPQTPDRPLCGWKDYYSWRGFPQHSLIACLLHFPLTLYYLITQMLPKDFCEEFNTIQQSKKICVHVIGAEKEVQMFFPFLECARLISSLSLEIHLFGNNFDDTYSQVLKKENLHFQIHKGLYHKSNHERIPAPSLAVCFNGGIGAYTSYLKTVKYLLRNKTPLYYTDYGQACIAFSTDTINNHNAGHVSEPCINPFRSPLRMVASDQNLPRYSNAFITHIKPLSTK